MAKFVLTEEILERFLTNKDLVVFKTTKKDFLESLPFKFDQYHYFNNMMYSLEDRVLSSSNEDYISIEVDNVRQTYWDNHPLWTLTKIQYFATHKVKEYYSPITFAYERNPNSIKFHPGSWRMAMIPYQENTLEMTMCIDTEHINAKILLEKFSNHEFLWARAVPYNMFCKFMNFYKFPGTIYIQNNITGVNFSTDRYQNLEYTGKYHLAYSRKKRIFFYNHKPLVRWKSNFWRIL